MRKLEYIGDYAPLYPSPCGRLCHGQMLTVLAAVGLRPGHLFFPHWCLSDVQTDFTNIQLYMGGDA